MFSPGEVENAFRQLFRLFGFFFRRGSWKSWIKMQRANGALKNISRLLSMLHSDLLFPSKEDFQITSTSLNFSFFENLQWKKSLIFVYNLKETW